MEKVDPEIYALCESMVLPSAKAGQVPYSDTVNMLYAMVMSAPRTGVAQVRVALLIGLFLGSILGGCVGFIAGR